MTAEIDGDARLSPYTRILYLWRNVRRNLRLGGGVPVQPLRAPLPAEVSDIASPSRALTEAFVRHTLPGLLPGTLVRVLDIGCGSGRTASLLAAAGLTGTYIGVDVFDRFSQGAVAGFDKAFVLGDAATVPLSGPFDLAISVSALEHIPDDRALLARLPGLLTGKGVQVHFVPAGAGLFVYLWHGFRQYTRRLVAERLVGQQPRLHALGGMGSLLVHLGWITLPETLFGIGLRYRFAGAYRACRAAGFAVDRVLPFFPSMYVIVVRAGVDART